MIMRGISIVILGYLDNVMTRDCITFDALTIYLVKLRNTYIVKRRHLTW